MEYSVSPCLEKKMSLDRVRLRLNQKEFLGALAGEEEREREGEGEGEGEREGDGEKKE